MSNTYTASIRYKTAVPRSKRLRDAGGYATSSSSQETSSGVGGDYVTRTTEQTITAAKTFSDGLNITGGNANRTLYYDSNGALHCKLPFISDSYISAYGAASGGGGGGTVDLDAVWDSLTTNTDDYADYKIDPGHLNLSGYATTSQLAAKQDALTFDTAPTSGSGNPVTSHGIYTALAGKQGTLTAGTGITITNNVISATGGTGGDFIPLDGSDVIEGSLSPNTNAAYDLGSSSYKWRYIYGTYLSISSLAVVNGGLKISGGSSVNSTFYVSNNKLHVYPEMVFDNNTFFSGNYNDLTNKPDLSGYATTASLAAVATSGSYNDLTNKPDLSGYATTASLATVATTGSYNDLTNRPNLSVYATTASLAAVATSGDYSDLSGTPNLGLYATKASLATVATTGSYNDLSDKPDMSGYATTASLASVATSGSYNDLTNKPDLSAYVKTVKLNGTALSMSSNAVNVNACTSITVPTGLSAASLTAAGVIAISLANGYAIPTTGNVTQITTNANAISTLQGYFTGGVANNASMLNCGDVGSASLPVYFDDGIPKACTLNLSAYVDLTSAQNISGVKTFVNGLDITGGTAERTIYKDSNNCLHVTLPIVCDSFVSAYGAGSSANVIDEMWAALAASGSSHRINSDHMPEDIPPEFVTGVDDDYTQTTWHNSTLEEMMISIFERLYNLEH